MKKNNKGFSLVELIIVIAIMAILAGAIAPALIKYIDKSRKSNDVNSCDTIKTAISTAMANEQIYELLTEGSDQTTGVAITNGKGLSAGSKVTAIIVINPPSGSTAGTVTITASTTAADAALTTTAQTTILSNIGEDTPKLKYKKAADGTNTPANYVVYITDKGTIYTGIGSGTTMHYEILPDMCDKY